MRRLQKRYEDEAAFRGLVDGIESFLRKEGFTSLDIRSAAALACLRHEMTTGRRDFTLDMIVNEAFPELGLVVKEPTLPSSSASPALPRWVARMFAFRAIFWMRI